MKFDMYGSQAVVKLSYISKVCHLLLPNAQLIVQFILLFWSFGFWSAVQFVYFLSIKNQKTKISMI